MKPNTALMDEILSVIEQHPDHWDQGSFARLLYSEEMEDITDKGLVPEGYCNSAFCVAGWACVLRGWLPVIEGDDYAMTVRAKNGVRDDVQNRAAKLLGLTSRHDIYALFGPSNSIGTIKQMWANIEAGKPAREGMF